MNYTVSTTKNLEIEYPKNPYLNQATNTYKKTLAKFSYPKNPRIKKYFKPKKIFDHPPSLEI